MNLAEDRRSKSSRSPSTVVSVEISGDLVLGGRGGKGRREGGKREGGDGRGKLIERLSKRPMSPSPPPKTHLPPA